MNAPVSPAASTFEDWTGFFGGVAGVSVTLFSVMFITFQVKSATWHSSRLKGIAAVASLIELLVPLFTALIALTAGHPWRVAAWIAGALGLAVVVIHWTLYVRDRGKPYCDGFDRVQARGAALSFAVYTGLIGAGFLSPSVGLYVVAGLSIWLLFSGAFEAWWLLEPKGLTPPP